MSVSIRFASVVATATIALGGGFAVSAASADDSSTPEPCARQQVQVDKAEAALERVTAVFARQEARVTKAKEVVAQAETGRAKAEARRALADAKHDRDEVKVTKRAQQQRVAKAQERLTECDAAETTEAPAAG
ncbi:hypothetical protein ASC64_13020 [Nocardioides sp. Root122]|uniref:hypothetical protein n=1 Tax=Nocardioides TaxID=1839 RepID=UPI000702A368|nr:MULTISPECIES: hypothetical protein [Nocardioides]KQV65816.1 hypothetical protein ASC64_13020 [Nocardioides sp. Root122]MCK9823265.1 hypothetical protein [Nocardioides cavernae]